MPSFLEDLIDACVMETWKRMKYEGRIMKWGRLSGAFSSFILHPFSASSPSSNRRARFELPVSRSLNYPMTMSEVSSKPALNQPAPFPNGAGWGRADSYDKTTETGKPCRAKAQHALGNW